MPATADAEMEVCGISIWTKSTNKAAALAELSIRKRYWAAGAVLSTEAWQKYGGVIAPELSDDAWNALTIAFVAVEHIEGSRAQYESSPLRDSPISDNGAKGVAPMLTDVTLGREALAPLARDDRALPQGRR